MKRLMFSLFLLVGLSLIYTSCSESLTGLDENQTPQKIRKDGGGNGRSDDRGETVTLEGCTNRESLQGSTRDKGLYFYDYRYLDFTCLESPFTLQFLIDVAEVPNYFRIIAPDGSVAYDSGWRGYANYGGTWGPSLNNVSGMFSGTAVINNPSAGLYTLEVRTHAPSHSDDAWGFEYCNVCAEVPPSNDCGENFSGLFTGVGSYTYPLQLIDLTGVAQGSNICVTGNPLMVPNHFTILDGDGVTPLTNSGWYGVSNQFGPWSQTQGGAINNPGPVTFSFTKGTSDYYYLKTWTVTHADPGKDDEWDVSITCDCDVSQYENPIGG